MPGINREIWFRCNKCGRESYCDPKFERNPKQEVMCPYCHTRMPLVQAKID